jgi:1-acyl-sn-glycerol-3-phosphate acyltransferase
MIRTVLFVIVFWLLMLFSTLLFPGLWLLKLLRLKNAHRNYIVAATTFWSRTLFAVAGVRVHLRGKENLPDHERICFISNHQSYGDIPVFIGFLGRRVGFIAKKELSRVPILATWIKALNCVFIDRGRAMQAMRGIEEGMARIEEGRSIVLFPEGTRAKDGKMKSFKAGGILMAMRQNITIVPVTIDGLYRVYELTGKVTPADVTVTIHSPIETSGLSREEQKALPAVLEAQVRSALTDHDQPIETAN